MSDTDTPETPDTAEAPQGQATPVHLWIVGVLSLLWSAMGALDFMMTQTKNEAYMSAFTPEQLAFFYGFPVWLVGVWAVAVWGGVLGSLLLLLRKGLAAPVFLASFAAMVITTLDNFVFSDGLEVIGDTFSLVFTAVIFLVGLALVFYARAMRRRGVLR